MTYVGRLLLLSSASFFLLQLGMQALIALLAPAAIRRARTMRPQAAAGFLLTLRLLPAAFAALIVAGLCLPSYLRFEPRVAEEEVGFLCLTAAISGAVFFGAAIWRCGRALVASSRYVRECGGRESSIEGERVWIVAHSAGLALAGIVRHRVLISEAAMRELSSGELSIALGHERAHRASRDNLKRMLILLAPPLFPALRSLERAWAKCAEWSADDRAADGDAVRSATLAAALVKVARLQEGIGMPALVTSLVEADEDLSLRVDRLLDVRLLNLSPGSESNLRVGVVGLSVGALLIGAFAANPALLRAVHQLLEHLLD